MNVIILESISLVAGDINQLAEKECMKRNRFNWTNKFQTLRNLPLLKLEKTDDFDDDWNSRYSKHEIQLLINSTLPERVEYRIRNSCCCWKLTDERFGVEFWIHYYYANYASKTETIGGSSCVSSPVRQISNLIVQKKTCVFFCYMESGIGNNEMCISLNVIHLRTINECDAKN